MKQEAVLIVGDEDIFSELLGRLPSSRYSLSFAEDHPAAMAQLERHRPCLVVLVLEGDNDATRALISAVREQFDAVCLGVASGFEPLSALCDDVVLDHDQVGVKVERLLARRDSELVTTPVAPLNPNIESRLADLAERLQSLESRVGEVALGTTGGLSELLQATDGLGQGLKEQMRALGDLERRLQEVSTQQEEWQLAVDAARAAQAEALKAERSSMERSPMDKTLEHQLEMLTERLEHIEGRVGEVALGTTGGLSELLQATDGLGQGLKTQGRAITTLKKLLDELAERQAECEAEVGALAKRLAALEEKQK
jgi:CheY-like chemotaxis protein